MKQILNAFFHCLVLCLMAYSCTTNTKKTEYLHPSDSIDLIENGEFIGYCDTLGSFVDSKPIKSFNMLTVAYMLAPVKNNDNWTWVDIECFFDNGLPWQFLRCIEITYKSNTSLALVLEQPVLLNAGESYRYLLPASSTWKSVTVPVSLFKQPEWAMRKDIPLNLQQLSSIGLKPEVDTFDSAYAGRFEVKRLIAYGLSMSMIDEKRIPPIIFYELKNNLIYLSVAEQGKYTIDIYNADNILVSKLKNIELNNGYNTIPFTQKLKSGAYKIRINGPSSSLTKSFVVGQVINTIQLK